MHCIKNRIFPHLIFDSYFNFLREYAATINQMYYCILCVIHMSIHFTKLKSHEYHCKAKFCGQNNFTSPPFHRNIFSISQWFFAHCRMIYLHTTVVHIMVLDYRMDANLIQLLSRKQKSSLNCVSWQWNLKLSTAFRTIFWIRSFFW